MYINNPGHMTKMATMPIYGKNPSKIFSGTDGLISTKHGMKHCCFKHYNAFECVKLLKSHLKGKTCRKFAIGQFIDYSEKVAPGLHLPLLTGAIFPNIQTCLLAYTADLR